ncbi:MAG TPA: hypothetical protein VHS56_05810 [Candidatus Cybelea sp.]|jgi:hypothetical protein|nr:hypothetical protein [Candidatus Cybelea sp.]
MKTVPKLALRALYVCASAALLGGCHGAQVGFSPPGVVALGPGKEYLARRACPEAPAGRAQCGVLILNERPQNNEPGWGARDIEAAYNLPSSSKGLGQIVAIIDAYDNPNVASDLAVYRQQYGLPPAKLYKYNQDGEQSNYPQGNPSWGVEIDLDTQMVSASCPKCTIYLIEANADADADFDTAEAEAVTLGAHITTNSWLCRPSTCVDRRDFDTPGVRMSFAPSLWHARLAVAAPVRLCEA